MPNLNIELNRVFNALADPTRRAVLEKLRKGPASVSTLAQPFDMALPSFTQHLKILSDCGLVKSEKSGRIRTYQLCPRPLKDAEHWLVKQQEVWEDRLDQLDSYLEKTNRRKP